MCALLVKQSWQWYIEMGDWAEEGAGGKVETNLFVLALNL